MLNFFEILQFLWTFSTAVFEARRTFKYQFLSQAKQPFPPNVEGTAAYFCFLELIVEPASLDIKKC